MPSKTSEEKQELALKLDKEPHALFYKDEGGKSNYLSASCTVCASEETKTFPIGNLRISPRLVYESGGEIEDEDEIFNVLSVDPKTITSTNEVFTVNFRIEKVSRRKDGKRFRLRFDINKDNSHLLDYVSIDNEERIETQAVTVLSKRKNHSSLNHNNTNPPILIKEESRLKKRRGTANSSPGEQNGKKEMTVPVELVLKLKTQLETLEQSVRTLNDRVAVLERRNLLSSPLRSGVAVPSSTFSRGQRVHSLMFDQYEDIAANCNQNTGIKRNGSSTTELFELLTASQVLN